MSNPLVVVVVVAATTATLVPLVTRQLRRRDLLDHPDHRTSHGSPTPRGGGLAFMVSAATGFAIAGSWDGRLGVAVGAATIAGGLLGALEDLRGLAARWRLGAQLAMGSVGCATMASAFHENPLAVVGLGLIGAVWFAAMVNAVNFMDGINGISGTYAVVAGVYFAWLGHDAGLDALAVSGAVLAGIGIGFLPFNVPSASVFMGDSGSYLIGALSALCVFMAMLDTHSIVVAGGPVAYYLVDTGLTIVRRRRRGESLMAPHRSHAYQRLVAGGWSHVAVSAFVGAIMAACALVGVVRWSSRTGGDDGGGGADWIAAGVVVTLAAAVLVVAARSEAAGRSPTGSDRR